MSFRSSNSRPFNSSVSASSAAAASKFNKNQVKKCKKSNNNNNPYYIPSDSEEESENESVYVSQKQRSVAKVSFSKKNEVKVYEVEVEFIDNFPSLVNDSCSSGASFTVDKKIKEKECSNNSSYLAALSKAREDSVKKNALGGIGFGIPIQVSKRPLRPFMNRTSENKEFVGEKKKFNVKTDNWATVDSDSDDE
jgi:hypothetical protein